MPATAQRETERHPILFSAPLVRAILNGEKTQTRRVMKPQPDFQKPPLRVAGELPLWLLPDGDTIKCPYGQPGDVLMVREAFQIYERYSIEYDEWDVWPGTPKEAVESGRVGRDLSVKYAASSSIPDEHGLRPSIHMPYELCRIRLRVEDVRVERVQEISFSDIVAEGVEPVHPQQVNGDEQEAMNVTRLRFRELWNDINADRGFPLKSNCWVWVVEFSRVNAE